MSSWKLVDNGQEMLELPTTPELSSQLLPRSPCSVSSSPSLLSSSSQSLLSTVLSSVRLSALCRAESGDTRIESEKCYQSPRKRFRIEMHLKAWETIRERECLVSTCCYSLSNNETFTRSIFSIIISVIVSSRHAVLKSWDIERVRPLFSVSMSGGARSTRDHNLATWLTCLWFILTSWWPRQSASAARTGLRWKAAQIVDALAALQSPIPDLKLNWPSKKIFYKNQSFVCKVRS